jgi:Tol biopolymer transport system component
MRVKVLLCAAVLAAVSAGAAPAHAAFPGQNGKLAFASDRSGNVDVWTMAPDGRGLRNLTANFGGADDVPNWSADGRQIVFESTTVNAVTNPTGDQEVFVMNADGSGRRQLTFNEADDGIPSWSPDGKRIVFHRWFGDFDADLMTIRLDGSDERNVTRSEGVLDRQGVWSPDGREIAFSRGGDAGSGRGDIYTIRPDGSNLRPLTLTAADEEYPDWSPDGRRIAFNTDRDAQFDIYVMRSDGSRQTRLTYNGAGLPVWSPDGRKIALTSDRSGNAEIYTLRAEGGRQRNRTESESHDEFADWQPFDRHSRAEDDDD